MSHEKFYNNPNRNLVGELEAGKARELHTWRRNREAGAMAIWVLWIQNPEQILDAIDHIEGANDGLSP